MIKIMIVEDMPVHRDYIHNFIDWNSYGFEICCEAKDGREALALYEQYQPDIVLTDIIMPYINGLELSERLLKENPNLSIILITGNSEFEYARKAVKLGVCDYIVKPFEKEELLIALLKLQDNINRVLELKSEKDRLIDAQKEQSLRQLIYARTTESKLISEQPYEFAYPYFIVATIRMDMFENQISSDEIVNWKQIFSSMLVNMITINGNHEVFHDFEGNIVIILNFMDKSSMEEYEGYEFFDIYTLAKENIGFTISVGISDYCYKAEGLREAYYQSMQALSNSYTENNTNVINFKKIITKGKREFYSWNLIEEINNALEVLDYERIEVKVTEELNHIKEYENMEFAIMVYMSILSLLFSYLVKHGLDTDDIFGNTFHPYTELNSGKTYIEKRRFIYECYLKAINYLNKHKNPKSLQIAKQAKKFIDENYWNPELTISDLSRELLLNQTYLRMMFKEEYQMTLSDYITKVRMENAKEMIQENVYKISYISSRVGYNDTSYFSKCFKKYFGFLPSDVKNA